MGRPHNYLQIFLKCLSAPIKSQKSFWILKRNWKIKEKEEAGGFLQKCRRLQPRRPSPCRHGIARRFLRRPDPPAVLAEPLPSLRPEEENWSTPLTVVAPVPLCIAVVTPTAPSQIGAPLCTPTRTARLDASRTSPDPGKHHAATIPCTLAAESRK